MKVLVGKKSKGKMAKQDDKKDSSDIPIKKVKLEDCIEEIVESKNKDSSTRSRGTPTPCPICGMIISNSYNLSCHLRRHNNIRPFKCDECPASFILATELTRHQVKHSKTRPFVCKICKKTFKNGRTLKFHTDSHGINKYECKYCHTIFKKFVEWRSHEIHAHSTNKLKCTFCYKTFSEMKFKEKHENAIHKNNKNKKQSSSDKKIDGRSKKNVNKQSRMVNGEYRFYSCNLCFERFKYRREQLSHYQLKHKEEFDNNFKICNQCGKILTAKYMFSHMQAHAGIFPFNCSLCDYKTNRKVDLKVHEATHSSDNKFNFKCTHCNKSFRQKSKAQLCEKRHEGKKDVKCTLCEMTFFTQSELTRHMTQMHKGRKCTLCDFKASSLAAVAAHKAKRHGITKKKLKDKKFMCDQCGSLFPNITYLKSHNLKHHSPDDLTLKLCYYCNFKYSSNTEFMSHCLKEHPNKVKKCKLCRYETVKINHFISHIKNHVEKCPEDLFDLPSIKKILKTKYYNYECQYCGMCTPEHDLYRNHVKDHITEVRDISRTSRGKLLDCGYLKMKKPKSSYVNLNIKCIPHLVDISRIEKKQYSVTQTSDDKFEISKSISIQCQDDLQCNDIFETQIESSLKNQLDDFKSNTTHEINTSAAQKMKNNINIQKTSLEITKGNNSRTSAESMRGVSVKSQEKLVIKTAKFKGVSNKLSPQPVFTVNKAYAPKLAYILGVKPPMNNNCIGIIPIAGFNSETMNKENIHLTRSKSPEIITLN